MSALKVLRSRLVSFGFSSKASHGFGLLFLTLTSALFAANSQWQNATKEELAQTESTLEPGVAAEAISRRIEIDDTDYRAHRIIKEYVRYKIFDPEKADRIMRLSKNSVSLEGVAFQTANMRARLTQPDGSTREFGAESIHERQVMRDPNSDKILHRVFGNEGLEVKEKFLAVGGALPGAVLEFQITMDEEAADWTTFLPIQYPGIPIRKFEFSIEQSRNSQDLAFQIFALNGGDAETKSGNGKRVTFTSKNLPSLRSEPLSGALPYYAATLVINYTRNQYTTTKTAPKSRHFSPDVPWARVATIENWLEIEHVTVTSGVKKTAAEITQSATSDVEKARLIHDYTAELYLRFLRQSKHKSVLIYTTDIVSMDDVINFEKRQPEKLTSADFLWLAISLYRAAGLNSEVVMLPNRRAAPFNRNVVSTAFLQSVCAAIKIGDKWHYSFPVAYPSLAFDELPWEHAGQGGLLALDNKQEFINIPLSDADHSVVRNEGTFQLDADGTLHGNCKLIFTGYEAYPIRSSLRNATSERQLVIARNNIRRQFQGAEIRVTDIANVADPYKPVEVAYTLRWPSFAATADKRLIFHPFVFRSHSTSPFSASERTYPVIFDFPHQEHDDVKITLPAGYELEVKNAPPSAPGKALSYAVNLTLNPKTRLLHSERSFSNELVAVGVKGYPAVKKWYDEISVSDQHQLVLIANEGPTSSPSTPTASIP